LDYVLGAMLEACLAVTSSIQNPVAINSNNENSVRDCWRAIVRTENE